MSETNMDAQLAQAALEYHRLPRPGKIAIMLTKTITNQRDLSLAYSPAVAAACLAIRDDPQQARELTSRAIWWRPSATAPRCSGSAISAP